MDIPGQTTGHFVSQSKEREALREHLGQVVEESRKQLGIKAERLGISRKSYYRLVNGEVWPREDTLKQVAYSLRVTSDQLIALARARRAACDGENGNNGPEHQTRIALERLATSQQAMSSLPLSAVPRVLTHLNSKQDYLGLKFNHSPHLLQTISSAFFREASLMLSRHDPFDLRNAGRASEFVQTGATSQSMSLPQKLSDHLEAYSASTVPRIRGSVFSSSVPVKVELPAALFSSALVFEYLRLVEGLNIELSCDKHLGRDVESSLQPEMEVDLVVLPLISAARYTACSAAPTGYQPLLMMPRGSQRLMASGKKPTHLQNEQGPVTVLGVGSTTTAHSYLAELATLGRVDRRRLSTISVDIGGLYRTLVEASGDRHERQLFGLWFPHTVFAEQLFALDYCDNADFEIASRESVLFGSKKWTLPQRKSELFYWLQRAINALRGSQSLLELVSAAVLRTVDYSLYFDHSPTPVESKSKRSRNGR